MAEWGSNILAQGKAQRSAALGNDRTTEPIALKALN